MPRPKASLSSMALEPALSHRMVLAAVAAAGYAEIRYLTRVDGKVTWQRCPLAEVKPCPR